MTVEVTDSIAELAPDWDELAERTGGAPFLRAGWFAAWSRAFGGGRLRLLSLRERGRLEGVMAFVPTRRGALVSPTNWHTPQFEAMAAGPQAHRRLADSLLERAGPALALRFLDPRGSTAAALGAAAAERGYRVVEREVARSPYVPIDGEFAEFERRLSRRRRKEIRRTERRLSEAGELAFAVEDGTERLSPLLDEGFAVEASGWKGRRGTAIASRRDTLRFYTELAEWAAGQGLLRLAFLRLDGRAVAFDFCLEAHGVHYPLKSGYREEYARYGPGALLTSRMIERAFDLGLSSYELLGEVDEFKRAWAADNLRRRIELRAFAPTARGAAERLVQTRVRPLAGRLARLRLRRRAAQSAQQLSRRGDDLAGRELA